MAIDHSNETADSTAPISLPIFAHRIAWNSLTPGDPGELADTIAVMTERAQGLIGCLADLARKEGHHLFACALRGIYVEILDIQKFVEVWSGDAQRASKINSEQVGQRTE